MPGVLLRDQILGELHSVFALIRDECAAFGRTKKGKLKDRVMLMIRSLDDAIGSSNPGRLLNHRRRWEGMVDPSSPQWIGISVPTDIIIEGYPLLRRLHPSQRLRPVLLRPFYVRSALRVRLILSTRSLLRDLSTLDIERT